MTTISYHENFDQMAYVSHDISPFVNHLSQIGVISEYNKLFSEQGYADRQIIVIMNDTIKKAMDYIFEKELGHHEAILYVRHSLDSALIASGTLFGYAEDFDYSKLVEDDINEFINNLRELGIINEYNRLFAEQGYPVRQAATLMNNTISKAMIHIVNNHLNYYDAILHVRNLLDSSLTSSDASISHYNEYAYQKRMQLA